VVSKNSSLEDAALAYAQVSMALRDYVIASWKSKYYYNVERPTSYIRRLIEPNWTTMLNDQTNGNKPQGLTPAFPAYPSGHSGMGGAAAVPMSDIFGSSYSMVDHCHEFRVEFNGKPRAFNNFYEMAYENAISRVPLGVHFEMDCIAGLELGYLAGKRVVELPWKK
jgi:membrane-associated phospholipid phosphatase